MIRIGMKGIHLGEVSGQPHLAQFKGYTCVVVNNTIPNVYELDWYYPNGNYYGRYIYEANSHIAARIKWLNDKPTIIITGR